MATEARDWGSDWIEKERWVGIAWEPGMLVMGLKKGLIWAQTAACSNGDPTTAHHSSDLEGPSSELARFYRPVARFTGEFSL